MAQPPAVATAQDPEPLLRVEGICKKFGNLEVLHGLSLTAYAGDVISMIGSSGSGKSTFLRCINFLEIPDAGSITLTGETVAMKTGAGGVRTIADRAQVQRLRARIGMVFQQFNLWAHMTILQNMTEAPVHVLGVDKVEARERAMSLLEKVGIADKADVYPSFLSGGQQQRAAIARALAMEPEAILFDEPTSALDPELVGEVLGVMRRLAEEGTTMIVVTHEMDFARDVSNKAMFLHQGLVEEEGNPREMFGSPKSERLRTFLSGTASAPRAAAA